MNRSKARGTAAVCLIAGCDSPGVKREWCQKHYRRWQRHGDPLYETTADDRLWKKIEFTDTCWLWLGRANKGGYGLAWLGRSSTPVATSAHRVVYERLVGPIPPDMQLDHLCRNRRCVNPHHLEVVTPRVNTLRGVGISAQNAVATHCKRGHPFDPANTLIDIRGSRVCRACRRELYLQRRAV